MEKLDKNWKEKPYLKGLDKPVKQYSSTLGLVWGMCSSLKFKLQMTWIFLLKRIDWNDLIGAIVILTAIYGIPKNTNWWMLYAFGCVLWMLIHISKKLYCGAFMNFVALVIAIGNFIRG